MAYGSWDFDSDPEGPNPLPSAAIDNILNVDSELKSVVSEVLHHLKFAKESILDTGDERDIAATTLSTLEANGALPPLTAEQRESFLGTLKHLARGLVKPGLHEAFDPENPEHWNHITDEGHAVIKPEFERLVEEVITLKIKGGWGKNAASRVLDAIKRGGDVGNIAISEGRGHNTGTVAVKSHPAAAEDEADRAEHRAEREYMDLQLNAFEPHASAVKEEWNAHKGGIGGDAPSAGGGMQTFGDRQQKQREPRSRPPASEF